MFKGLGKKLNERASVLDRTEAIVRHTRSILGYYHVTADIQYDHHQDTVVIQTNTKTGASELLLHHTDITELLRHAGYGVRKILIR